MCIRDRMAGVKGIIHSDENLEKYKISDEEVFQIKEALELKEKDAFILVAGPESIVKSALEKVYERAMMDFIPMETRVARQDKTYFMRPIAGRARMYPETDIPPQLIEKKRLEKIKMEKGKGIGDTKAMLEKYLNKDLAKKMLKSRHLNLFMNLVEEGHDAKLVANTLEQKLIEARREGINVDKITDTSLKKLFGAYKKGLFAKTAILEILKHLLEDKSIEQIVEENGLEKIKGKELEKIVEEEKGDIAEIMRKYRLNIDPEDVQALIKKKPIKKKKDQ